MWLIYGYCEYNILASFPGRFCMGGKNGLGMRLSIYLSLISTAISVFVYIKLWRHLLKDAIKILFYRALYFSAYSQAKQLYNNVFHYESPAVHLASAISAGACTHTHTHTHTIQDS